MENYVPHSQSYYGEDILKPQPVVPFFHSEIFPEGSIIFSD